jgi:uric acid-xanthine permease
MASDTQPAPTPAPNPYLSVIKYKLTTKDGWVGDYDFVWLCKPALPVYHPERKSAQWRKTRRPPPFFALDQDIPLLLAIVCGLQHALAMLAGLITPPILFASALSLDPVSQVRPHLYLVLYLIRN